MAIIVRSTLWMNCYYGGFLLGLGIGVNTLPGSYLYFRGLVISVTKIRERQSMDDLLWAMSTLVCEDYIDPLKVVQRDLELKDSSSKYMPIIAEKHIFETSTLVQNYRNLANSNLEGPIPPNISPILLIPYFFVKFM